MSEMRRYIELASLMEDRVPALRTRFLPQLQQVVLRLRIPAAMPKDPEGLFNLIVSADPAPNRAAAQWLLMRVLDGGLPLEDLGRATAALRTLAKVKARMPMEQRDLGRYGSLRELEDALQPFEDTTSKREEDRALDAKMRSEARILLDDPNYLVLIPQTQAASCHFGQSTKWCTAATEGWNAFEQYSEHGPLYIILHKPTNRRWQFQITRGWFMDERDNPISPQGFFAEHPTVREVILTTVTPQSIIDSIRDTIFNFGEERDMGEFMVGVALTYAWNTWYRDLVRDPVLHGQVGKVAPHFAEDIETMEKTCKEAMQRIGGLFALFDETFAKAPQKGLKAPTLPDIISHTSHD